LILKLKSQGQIIEVYPSIAVLVVRLQQSVSEKDVIGTLEEDPNVENIECERSVSPDSGS
jgi:hypothetical protein